LNISVTGKIIILRQYFPFARIHAMKRLFTLFLILFCLSEVKGQILWERIEKDTITYRDHYTKLMVKDSLVYLSGIGYWNFYGNNYRSFYSCYNINGKLKWRKNGSDIPFNGGGDLIIDSDSMLLTYRFNQTSFKIDWQKVRLATGDTLRSKRFTVPYSFRLIADGFIVKEPNGSYVIGGGGPAVSKINNSGSPAWTKKYSWYNSQTNAGYFDSNGFFRKSNGNYIMGGSRTFWSNNVTFGHPMLIEFKPNGDTLKTKTFILEHPQYYEESIYANLTQTRKGDFLFSGRIDTIIDNCNGCDAKYYVAKADAQFNLKWIYINKGILKDYYFLKVSELEDSSSVGVAISHVKGNYLIMHISKNGTYLAHKTYSNAFCNGSPMLWDWGILPDGTIIVAGKCKHHGYSYVARVTGFGPPAKPVTNNPVKPGSSEVLYPPLLEDESPEKPEAPEKPLPADLFIYDLTGRIIKRLVVTEHDITKLKLDLPGCSNGVYIYKLITQTGKVSTRKVVLLR
jgi:hypothetical protein